MSMKIPHITSSNHVRWCWAVPSLHSVQEENQVLYFTLILLDTGVSILLIKRPCDIMNNTFVDNYECTVYKHNIPRYVQRQKWMDTSWHPFRSPRDRRRGLHGKHCVLYKKGFAQLLSNTASPFRQQDQPNRCKQTKLREGTQWRSR